MPKYIPIVRTRIVEVPGGDGERDVSFEESVDAGDQLGDSEARVLDSLDVAEAQTIIVPGLDDTVDVADSPARTALDATALDSVDAGVTRVTVRPDQLDDSADLADDLDTLARVADSADLADVISAPQLTTRDEDDLVTSDLAKVKELQLIPTGDFYVEEQNPNNSLDFVNQRCKPNTNVVGGGNERRIHMGWKLDGIDLPANTDIPLQIALRFALTNPALVSQDLRIDVAVTASAPFNESSATWNSTGGGEGQATIGGATTDLSTTVTAAAQTDRVLRTVSLSGAGLDLNGVENIRLRFTHLGGLLGAEVTIPSKETIAADRPTLILSGFF